MVKNDVSKYYLNLFSVLSIKHEQSIDVSCVMRPFDTHLDSADILSQ